MNLIFTDNNLLVRKLERKDSSFLVKWLSDPLVLKYYEGRDNSFDEEKVEEVFFQEEEDIQYCIVEYNQEEVGFIQYYQLEDSSRNTYGYKGKKEIIYGIDQFIGEKQYWNQGIGTLLVQSMMNFLSEQKQADKIVMDPQAWNTRALRCYEKCGFKKVRLLPKNELHEGEYRDCWLMEWNRKESDLSHE